MRFTDHEPTCLGAKTMTCRLRIRATPDFLAKAFASERKLLEGKQIDAAVKRQRP